MEHGTQSRECRRRIIREYLGGVIDSTERVVCHLFMKELDDRNICRILAIRLNRLQLIKTQIALKLINAGLAVGDCSWK